MNIYYHRSSYISHYKAGEGYIQCLRALGHDIVDDPALADSVILHGEPLQYPAMLAALPPAKGRKHVGYAVWETPQLPPAYAQGIAGLDAVWTASAFSREAFAAGASCPVYVLPHVVERARPARDDMAALTTRLGMDARPKPFFFYTVADAVNPRKNLSGLLLAFATAFPDPAANVRLVVKQYRSPQPLEGIANVISLPEMLSEGEMAALHALCDCYASAHHAEAWGLPLSEALAFGNPVIATGYSGNMEFMTARNSFPMPYTVAPVTDAMCAALPNLFTRDMTWADIDIPALVAAMRRMVTHPVTSAWRQDAAASMRAFSPQAVAERLQDLLNRL